MRINKPKLVEEILLHDAFAGATKSQVTAFVDDFFQFIADKVVAGNEVAIAGFGKFEKYERQNGTFKPKFTPFKDFKDKVLS